MKTSIFKRSIALVMAMVMCVMAFTGAGVSTVSAAGEEAEVFMIGFPRDGDANYDANWGHPTLNFMNGWTSNENNRTNIRAMGSYDGNICYCIEPGVAQDPGDTYTSRDESFWDNFPSDLNQTISADEIKTFIGRILQYGYTGPISLSWRSQNEGGDTLAHAVATQLLIWETIVGERDSSFGKVDPGSCDAILDSVTTDHPLYNQIHSYYDSIAASVKNHAKLPSFFAGSTGKAQVVEMEWNGTAYTAALTDSNGVLSNYSFTANATGITFHTEGNTLHITAQEAPAEAVTITASRNNSQRMGLITWTDGVYGPDSVVQDMIAYTQSVNDPVAGYLKVQVSRCNVKIIKVDAETGKVIPYAGAAFQIYRPDGTLVKQTVNEIDTFYTNDEGFLVTPESLEYGTGYALVEVKAPYGYVINSEPVYFDVTQDNSTEDGGVTIVEVTKANTAQKGIIKIYKTGEVFASAVVAEGVYQAVYAEQGLPGAVYEITAAEDVYTLDGTLRYAAGEVVDTITTDETGYATSKTLYLGKFNIQEITAPVGMVINSEPHTAELVYAGQEVEITEVSASFTNKRQKVSLFLGKTMEQNDTFHIGMNGEVTAVTFGLYAAEGLVAADGSIIPADGLMEVVSVNGGGTAKCQSDLPFGRYYLKEMTTDSQYILSDEKYPFTFTYEGPTFEVVEIVINDGNPIINELIYGVINGLKVNEDGEGLSGAVIGLFHADENVFTAETAIMTTVTADQGCFNFSQVPYGNWIVREIEAPEGYILSDALYPVTIAEDSITLEIQITNTCIRGNVQLTKVDKDYPENTLAGAVFELYADSNGNGEFDHDDELLGQLEELSGGVYQMNALAFGSYFVKEKTAPMGFYLDANAYYFQITENGKTVIVENAAGKGFINNAQRGIIRIEKTSEDKVVKGFTFKVEGTDITGQPYSKTFVTDENGEIHIEGLRIGTYVISEVSNEATEKYELPPDVTVNVLEGKTTVAKFYNKLTPDTPDIPKTGDETNTALWGIVALITLAGAGVTGFLFYRDSKKKNHK